jgi:hypothetical protein
MQFAVIKKFCDEDEKQRMSGLKKLTHLGLSSVTRRLVNLKNTYMESPSAETIRMISGLDKIVLNRRVPSDYCGGVAILFLVFANESPCKPTSLVSPISLNRGISNRFKLQRGI